MCKMTTKLADSLGLEYDYVDVTDDFDKLEYIKNDLGFSTLPVIETDTSIGNFSGFRPDLIKKLV